MIFEYPGYTSKSSDPSLCLSYTGYIYIHVCTRIWVGYLENSIYICIYIRVKYIHDMWFHIRAASYRGKCVRDVITCLQHSYGRHRIWWRMLGNIVPVFSSHLHHYSNTHNLYQLLILIEVLTFTLHEGEHRHSFLQLYLITFVLFVWWLCMLNCFHSALLIKYQCRHFSCIKDHTL